MSVPRRIVVIIGSILAVASCSSENAGDASAPASTTSSIVFDVPYSIVQDYDRYAEADDPAVAAWHDEVEPILSSHDLSSSGLIYWRDVARDSGVSSIVVIHGNIKGECDFMLVATRAADQSKLPAHGSDNPARCDAVPTSTAILKRAATGDGSLAIVAVDWRSSDGSAVAAILSEASSIDGRAIADLIRPGS